MGYATRILLAVIVVVASAAPGINRRLAAAGEYPTQEWAAWREHSTNRYPQETWLKYATPEEAGWSSQKLKEAEDSCGRIDAAAVMIVYDGAVLAEWGDVHRRYMCHSIRKSLLNALYGIHVAEGNIDLDKTLAELRIDDQPPLSNAEKQARVGDLLKSRSGVYHAAAYETPPMAEQRPPRGSNPPGAVFSYNNWDFNALGSIFERQTGRGIFAEFQRRIAVPLQMEDFRLQDTYYHLEKQHSIHPAYPFRMSARDMARFGLLFLRQGKWNDQQIVPAEWVEQTATSYFRESDCTLTPEYGYGYLWWPVVKGPLKELGMYSARGYGGHSIDVLPRADLVFVLRVDSFWDLSEHLHREQKLVEDADRFKLLETVLRARVAPPKTQPRMIPARKAPARADQIQLDPSLAEKYTGKYRFEAASASGPIADHSPLATSGRGTQSAAGGEASAPPLAPPAGRGAGGERSGNELSAHAEPKHFTLHIKKADHGLLIGSATMGEFSLLPLSPTRFIIEDLEAPVLFELDEHGKPARITIQSAPGYQCRGRPLKATEGR